MILSKRMKIVIGVLTAGEVLFPFLSMAVYLLFIFSLASADYSNSTSFEKIVFPFIFIFFLVFFCVGIIHLALQIFYLVHVILNKSGNDVLKIVLGLLAFFISPICMPIYYFVYIWPDTPPAWALSTSAVSSANQPQG